MRNICAGLVSVALITSSAFAASDTNGTLAAGKPAGVKAAQDANSGSLLLIVGGIAVVGAVALGLSSNNSSGAAQSNSPLLSSTTTTTTTQ